MRFAQFLPARYQTYSLQARFHNLKIGVKLLASNIGPRGEPNA
jgi:hypothetical protein